MVNKAYYTAEVPEDRFETLSRIKELVKPLKIILLGGVDSADPLSELKLGGSHREHPTTYRRR